ncbi:MAG: lysylphosphatidylglycerol synthase transmembrane domain-containing protein [bacterium]|nr:lysylphosphatidylglycerol synthase transmembrane domain-containing protein [bacterium]
MKKLIINIVKILVTVTIIVLIFKKLQIGYDDIIISLKHSPGWFVASFLMQLGAILFSILRWNVLMVSQDLKVPFSHLVKTFMVGRFLGTFTPTGIGLEAYKAYDIARYTGKPEASVSVVLIEKMIATFFSLSLLVLLTLPFFLGRIDVKFLLVFGLFFGVLLVLALVLLFSPGLLRKVLRFNFPMKAKIEKPLNRTVDAFTIYSQKRGGLMSAILLGLVVYIFWFLTYYMNSLALGAGLTLVDVLKVGPMTQIATMIPLSIAGIGLREGAFIGLLDSLGLVAGADPTTRSAMVLSATMVYFISISVNIIGAVIFLTRKTDYQRQIKDMTNRTADENVMT